MKAPKSGKRKRIDWQRIIKEGTGFFGWPSLNIPGLAPLAFEAKQGTWNRMAQPQATGVPLIEEAESLGADGDLLRACCLYLSEIAVEHHQSRDTLRLPDGEIIHLGGLRETMKYHVERLQQDLKRWHSLWAEAKAGLLCHTTKLLGADRIENAHSELDRALTSLFRAYFPLEERDRSPGRPREYYSLVTLSGIAWHLKRKIPTPRRKREPARHALLSRMAESVLPSLPVATTPERLRSQISRHRKNHKNTGEADYIALVTEFRKMRRRFLDDRKERKILKRRKIGGRVR